MNYKMMGKFISFLLILESVFMIPSAVLAFFDDNKQTLAAFLITIVATLAIGLTLYFLTRGSSNVLFAKEGFFCVALGWIFLSVFGAFPLFLSREVPSYLDALFEIISGFTTTGTSVIDDVESLSRAVLYWRSFTHWVGGMGVLVFLLAIVPAGKSGGYTMHLFRAESPGPDVGKLSPRLSDTARALYLTYFVLTLLNFAFLLPDMDWFEALCTAFGTAGTGGFGLKNDSLASYSVYIQIVTTIFMFLFGINFSCYYLLLRRKIKAVLRDEELHVYLSVVVLSILAITFNIWHRVGNFADALNQSSFTVTAIISTTGYGITDIDSWPMLSKAILMLLMITGSCAGSTCGGMKLSRVMLLFKNLKRNISAMVHPGKVEPVRINGNPVSESVIANTNIYFVAYGLILAVSFLLVSAFDNNITPTSAFTSVLTCFNNIGPGFEASKGSFSYLSAGSKIVLMLDMLAGRLEIFPLFILFSPSLYVTKKYQSGDVTRERN